MSRPLPPEWQCPGGTPEYEGHTLRKSASATSDWVTWRCSRCGHSPNTVTTDDITVEDYSTRGPGYVVTCGRHGSVTVSEEHRAIGMGCYVRVDTDRVPRHEGRDWRECLFAEAMAIVAAWGES